MEPIIKLHLSNSEAYKIGLIASEVVGKRTDIGDEIDRGLILQELLNKEGFSFVRGEKS